MNVFTYSPSGDESVKAFNTRLMEYCSEDEVIAVEAAVLGRTLVLTCTEADDVNAPSGVPVLTLAIRKIKENGDVDLEEYLQDLIDKIEEQNEDLTEDISDTVPIDIKILNYHDKPGEGYAVIVCMVGIFTAEEEDDDHDHGGDDGDPEPPEGGDDAIDIDAPRAEGYETDEAREVEAEVVKE